MTAKQTIQKASFAVVMMIALGLFNGPAAGAISGSSSYAPDFMVDKALEMVPSPSDNPKKTLQSYFREGYADYSKKKYQSSAEKLFSFITAQTPDAQDYEWAEFFFGISLYKLGFTHGAVDALTHLVTQKPNVQIVSYSLELLEQISRTVPFDRNLLIQHALCDQSYDFIQAPLSNFIHYYQGEYDWERGFFGWGEKHFSQIPEDSFYYNKYLFVHALRLIYDNRIDEAISTLKTIIGNLEDGDPLKDDARKTLARLFYEKGQFVEADLLYQQIEMNIVEQSQTLLERAWAHYRMGNPERAMGLLYSFEAPSYVNSFTPEFYILKSFIYKDVCHYRAALDVLNQFKSRYGGSLESIYRRKPLQDNEAMLLVILNKPAIKRRWAFIQLLEREKLRAQNNPDPNLQSYLVALYALKQKEVEQQFRARVTDAYEKMANEMLRFEEEAHLMEYEIGIDMYQRVHDYHFSEETFEQSAADTSEGKAIYAFQGEFWNDELDDYEVVLPNKCKNAEEWDIFFK